MLIMLLISGFILASIPFGYIFAKRLSGINLQEQGSHNIGFTNAMRVAGVKVGILTLVCDLLKGALPLAVAKLVLGVEFNFFPPSMPSAEFSHLSLVVLAVVAGHCYTPFLRGKGGKGVATGFAAMAVYMPTIALSMLVIFLVISVLTRYISLASIVAALSLPLWVYVSPAGGGFSFAILSLVAAIVLIRHQSNITRLIQGTEASFRSKDS